MTDEQKAALAWARSSATPEARVLAGLVDELRVELKVMDATAKILRIVAGGGASGC